MSGRADRPARPARRGPHWCAVCGHMRKAHSACTKLCNTPSLSGVQACPCTGYAEEGAEA